MILADKIIQLRKKQGWSQEELAERLDVSRQSVSKWEGAQSTPDLNKILAMADLFGVSTDYLLREDLEEAPSLPLQEEADAGEKYRVSMEEAVDYLAATEKVAGKIAGGVALCILSPILTILLAAAGEAGRIPLTEDQGGILGAALLLLMIAAAVIIFVWCGGQRSRFENLSKLPLETAYGVTGMVRQRKQDEQASHIVSMAVGIGLCVVSAAPVMVCTFLREEDELLMAAGIAVLLALVAPLGRLPDPSGGGGLQPGGEGPGRQDRRLLGGDHSGVPGRQLSDEPVGADLDHLAGGRGPQPPGEVSDPPWRGMNPDL